MSVTPPEQESATDAAFNSISMQKMEEAFAIALATLTGSEAKVAICRLNNVSDGADRLIGQDRWRLGVVVTVARPDGQA